MTDAVVLDAVSLARARIAAGDLQGAITPLERALLIAPDADDVRLVYADTLYRLGDAEGAEREAALVAGRTTGRTASAADELRARAANESARVRTRGMVLVGGVASTDPTLGRAGTGDDLAAVAGLRGRTEVDIAGTGGGFAFARTLLRAEAWEEAPLDGARGNLALGVSLPFGDLDVVPSLLFASDLLSDGTRSETLGARIDLAYGLTARTQLRARASLLAVEQGRATPIDGSGERASVGIGLAGRIGPGIGAVAMLGAARFEADAPPRDYDEVSASLDLTAQLPGGATLLASASGRELDFADGRDDTDVDLYVGLRAPLDLGGALDLGALDGVGVQAGLRHRARRSSVAGLDGEDTALEVLLFREFRF